MILYTSRKPYKPRARRVPVISANYANGSNEKNACAVRALAVAACLPYDDVHALCKRLGRVDGKPTPWFVISGAIRQLAPDATEVLNPRLTFQAFAERHNTGHWIVCSRNHAIAVCDGHIHDWSGSRVFRRVYRAWRLV